MPYVTVGQDSATIDLYEDLGTGQPIVLIHGFPSTVIPGKAGLSAAECRVSSHYLRSPVCWLSQPSSGYDTFAADLNTLMTKLDLQNTVLVGFSMGTGEVTRYLGKYGSERVQKAVLMAPVPPFC